MKPLILRFVGFLNVLFALLGFFDIAQFSAGYHGSSQVLKFISLVWICNGIFDVFLFYSGVRLIQRPAEGHKVASRVMMVELSYIFLFLALSHGRGHLGELVSEFFGVGGAGLTFQVLALYPVWSLLLLLFSKPDAPGSHSPAVINGG